MTEIQIRAVALLIAATAAGAARSPGSVTTESIMRDAKVYASHIRGEQ